jgi:hypothetical protein
MLSRKRLPGIRRTAVAPISIGFGVVLMILGVGFYFATGQVSPTALIPSGFGVVMALLGAIALKEGMRKHAMHLAAMVGLVGFLIPIGRVLLKGSTMAQPAVAEHLIMAALCLVFVLLCVRSFVVARRNRARQAAP